MKADGINTDMVSDREGLTEKGLHVPIGTTVEYCGHVVGGMVRVRFADGTKDVMHPHCFPGLR